MKALIGIKKFLIRLAGSVQSGIFDLREVVAGFFVIVFASNQLFGQDGILDNIITLGMAVLVLYGVMKLGMNILWLFLFGRKFEWKIGVLEIFFRHLKVNRAIHYAENNDESSRQAEQVVEMLKNSQRKIRQKSGRWKKMIEKLSLFFKNFNRNKKTNLALVSVVAMVITALDHFAAQFGILNVSVLEHLTQNAEIFEALIGAEALALAAIITQGIKGAGFESEEQAQARIAKKQEAQTEANKNAETAKVEANRIKVAKNIIKTANQYGANPVKYAQQMQVMPEIIQTIQTLINK